MFWYHMIDKKYDVKCPCNEWNKVVDEEAKAWYNSDEELFYTMKSTGVCMFHKGV